MTIFGDLYEISARTKLQGLFSLVWGTSSVAGPLAGGAIVLHWSWPWVFWLNVPFGLVSAIVIGVLLRGRDVSSERPRLDLIGALLLTMATLSLLVALLPETQRPLDLSPAIWLAVSAALSITFVMFERRHEAPLVPLRLFRDRVQLAANVTGVLLGVVLFGIIGYLPLYIQVVRGGTPVEAGAAIIPLSFGWTMATIIAGRLVRRVGFRALVRTGCLSVGVGAVVGMIGLSLDELALTMLGIILYGVGMGSSISSFTVAIQERVEPKEKGIATALSQFSRSIGGAVGVALFGALLLAVAGVGVAEAGSAGALGSDGVERLAEGLEIVFISAVGVAVLAAIVGIVLFPKMAVEAPKSD
jgi:MFS family permease